MKPTVRCGVLVAGLLGAALVAVPVAVSEPPSVSFQPIRAPGKTGVSVCVSSSQLSRPWTMRIFDVEYTTNGRDLSRGVRVVRFHLGDTRIVNGSAYYRVVLSGNEQGECARLLLARTLPAQVPRGSAVFGGFNIRASTGGRIRAISLWHWQIRPGGRSSTIRRAP
jgi:hypothetical protein